MRALAACSLLILAAATTGCKARRDPRPTLADAGPVRLSIPGTPEGARAVANEFAKPGAHPLSIFKALRPAPEDYDAVFLPEAADKIRASLDPVWVQGNMTMNPPTQQGEVIINAATVEELLAGTGKASACPKSCRKLAKHMKPGITMYCFQLIHPGEGPGKLHDGLIYVNDHWAFFPKAYTFYQWGLAEAGLLEDDD